MTCNDATLSLGVYLVGALEPVERAQVERHLARCADCRRELDELTALPSVLDLLRLEDVEPIQAAALGIHSDGSDGLALIPPDDLFERFAARARGAATDEPGSRHQQRSRLTRFRALTAAAAAVIVIGGGVGIGVAVSGGHSSGINVSQGTVDMQVHLASQANGTSMQIEVAGLPEDEHCRLIAIGKDGTHDLAGQWNATYAGKAKFWGSTSIPKADLARLVLLGTNGQTLVSAAV